MATKITTALVAALAIGALMMTANHEAFARGGFGGGFHGRGFRGVEFGFHGGFGHGLGYGRRFGFTVAVPIFIAAMGMAAVLTTTDSTGAIEHPTCRTLNQIEGTSHGKV